MWPDCILAQGITLLPVNNDVIVYVLTMLWYVKAMQDYNNTLNPVIIHCMLKYIGWMDHMLHIQAHMFLKVYKSSLLC